MAVFESGAKSTEEKPRYDLIPIKALEREAARMAHGARVHGENNYQRGADDDGFIKDRVNHLIEHALKYATGDRSDDHLAAIRCNAGMLIWIDERDAERRTFRHGRFLCPSCKVVRAVVRDSRVTEIRCPQCDTVALPANGDEV